MEERIKQIMSDIFFLSLSEINENSSQDTIANWDSIGNLNLVTALEEEFEIVFKDEEIIEMLNYKLVVDTVESVLKRK